MYFQAGYMFRDDARKDPNKAVPLKLYAASMALTAIHKVALPFRVVSVSIASLGIFSRSHQLRRKMARGQT
jgi:hypothetical protein